MWRVSCEKVLRSRRRDGRGCVGVRAVSWESAACWDVRQRRLQSSRGTKTSSSKHVFPSQQLQTCTSIGCSSQSPQQVLTAYTLLWDIIKNSVIP